MKIFSRIAMAATMFAVVLNCNGKSTLQVATAGTEIKAPAEATSVQARVLADTGATLSIGSSVQLTVPAGALDKDTDISVTKIAAALPQENLVPIGNSIELGAHGTEFNKSVSLNTCYDPAVLAAKGLTEDTIQVYYLDLHSGNYAAIGGSVNKGSHCVAAQLQHFSTYLIAAQILQGGNNQPVVSAPTFMPSVPLAGAPLKISSVITDFELSAVNGQIGFGQVATAQLFYRIPGEPSFTQVALTPDYLDDTATRYSYKIPANRVTAAGIEYYLKATDNLGLNRVRNTAVLPIARTAVSVAFQTNAAVDLAAGFKRSYTLRAIDDLGTARNIDVDTFTLNGGIGTAAKTSASVVQVSAMTANAQNYRIGSLTATAGPFSVTSADIRVHAGMLDHIALLSPTGVVLGTTITVNANAAYDFDVIGYDAFGNTSNVLPLFVIVPVSGAGTITPTGLYTAPATAQTATLVATLDGVMDSILINVVVPPAINFLGYDFNLGTARPLDSVSDTSGNTYSVGYSTVAFDGQPRIGTQDGFIIKYDSVGNRLWTKFIGVASSQTDAQGVATDSAGNVYVTGGTWGNLDGQIGTGVINAYVVKYDGAGNKLWTHLVNSGVGNVTMGMDITVDGSSFYIVTSTSAALYSQPLTGSSDTAVIKHDLNGNEIWTRLSGTAGALTQVFAVGHDAAHNVYLLGNTDGALDGQSRSAISIYVYDQFVIKYDAAGNKQWTRLLGNGVTAMNGRRMAVSGAGEVYTPVAIANYASQLSKYDTTGNLLWSNTISSSGINSLCQNALIDALGKAQVVCLVIDAGGTGLPYTFQGLSLPGNDNGVILTFDGPGAMTNARHVSQGVDIRGVSIGSSGQLWVAGLGGATIAGIPGPGPANIFLYAVP